jgi:hypothetical protein
VTKDHLPVIPSDDSSLCSRCFLRTVFQMVS